MAAELLSTTVAVLGRMSAWYTIWPATLAVSYAPLPSMPPAMVAPRPAPPVPMN
jgi:hypothetical protein